MRTTTTTIEVTPCGIPVEIEIEISWTRDPGVWRDKNGDGCPPSDDIEGWEYDEPQAVADFWAAVDEEGEYTTKGVIAQLAEKRQSVREAIAAQVASAVETVELVDDGEDDE
jgi:hypothetical protein